MKTRGQIKQEKRETKKKKNQKKQKQKSKPLDSDDESSDEEVVQPKKTQIKKNSKANKKKQSKKQKQLSSDDESSSSSESEKPKKKSKQTPKKLSMEKKIKSNKSKVSIQEEVKEEKKKDKKEDEDNKEDKKKQKPESEEKIVKQTVKFGGAVDQYCKLSQIHVYSTASKHYDATLNQSNVVANNNKFYRIQLLEKDDSKQYYLWNRWGRVGVVGQSALKGPMPLEKAIQQYEDKLYEKTVKGNYKILEITLDNEDEEVEDKKKEVTGEKVESKLPTPVQNLISLIFDMKMMNQQMKEIGYDAKKMPLGKLSKQNLQHGYELLTKISDAIKQKKPYSLLQQYSSDFYSYIPHDFGFKNMANFILDTEAKVKNKIEMIQSIADIQIATKLLEDKTDPSEIHQFDANYSKLHCELEPVSKNSEEFKIIQKYLENTHAPTHTAYTLEIIDIFKVDRENESKKFRTDITENKMLLWHGSRLTNYVGILSQGLRIAPPEAPATGYMFGKGVYFADMVSKSANYCFTNQSNNTGLLILNEVACGKFNEKFYADYNANILPKGKLCTKGCGRIAPPESSYVDLNGFKVPVGQGENIPVQGSLQYNEYIVYDINQIKMKYLLRCKFNYKKGGFF